MDLTPKPPRPRRSLFNCCRPPASPAEEQDESSNEDIIITPTASGAKVMFDISPQEKERVTEKYFMQKERDVLMAESYSMQHEIDSLRREVSKISAAKATETDKLRKDLESVKESFAETKKNRDAVFAEKESMQKKINSISTERDEFLSEKESMQQEIESLLNNVAEITAGNAMEVDNLRMDLETSTAERDELSSVKITNMQKELESARSSLIDTTTVRDKLTAENAKLQDQIDTLQRNLSQISADKEVEVGNIQLDLELVREQLEETEENEQSLTKELEVSKRRMEIADKSIETLTAQRNAAHAERDKVREDMSVKLDEITTREERQTQEIAQQTVSLLTDLVHANEKSESLSEELNDAKKGASQAQEELVSKMKSLEADLLESKEDSAAKSSEIETIAKNKDDLLAERDSMQKGMSAISLERDEILAEKNSMQQKVESFLAHEAETTVAKRREVENLEKDLESAKMEFSAIKDTMQQRIETLESNLSEVTASKEREVKTLQQELSSLQKSLSEELHGAKKGASLVQEELISKIKSLEADILSKEDSAAKSLDVENLLKELETTTKHKDDLLAERDSMQKEVSDISLERETLLTEKDSMEQKIESLLTYEAVITVANRKEVENLENDLESAKMKYAAIKETMQHRIETLESNFTFRETEIGTSQHELGMLQKKSDDAAENAKGLPQDNMEACQGIIETTNNSEESSSSQLKDAKQQQTKKEKKKRKKKLRPKLTPEEGEDDEEGGELGFGDIAVTTNQSSPKEAPSVKKPADIEPKAERDKLNGDVAARLKETTEQKDTLTQEMARLSTERDELLAEKESMQQKIDSLLSEVSEVTAATLYAQLNVATERDTLNEDMVVRLQQKESQAQEMSQRIESLSGELENSNQKRKSLSAELDDAKKAASQAQEQLNAKIQSLEIDLIESKEDIAHKANKVESLHKKLEITTKNMNKILAEKGSMEKEMIAIKKKKDEISASKDSLQQEIDSLKVEVAEITAAKAYAIQSLQKELQTVQKSFIDITRNRDELLSEENSIRTTAPTPARHNESLTTPTKAESTAQYDDDLSGIIFPVSPAQLSPIAPTSPPRDLFSAREPTTPVIPTNNLLAPQSSVAVAPRSATTAPVDNNYPQSLPADDVVTVHGFSHQGLIVVFKCTKLDALNNQKSIIVAKFSNATNAPFYGLHLQVAVPKYITMKLKPPTSTTVPVTTGRRSSSTTREVTQTIHVTNTMLGTKKLMLKLRASFTSNGKRVEHMATCSGFPVGQF